jgi:hypothetical protein
MAVTLKLTATLTDISGAPLSGKTITFYYSYDGSTWTTIGSATTDANGQASVTHTTDRTTYYKAEFAGDPEYDASSATAVYTVSAPPPTESQAPSPTTTPSVPVWLILLILLLLLAIVALTEERRRT